MNDINYEMDISPYVGNVRKRYVMPRVLIMVCFRANRFPEQNTDLRLKLHISTARSPAKAVYCANKLPSAVLFVELNLFELSVWKLISTIVRADLISLC